MKERHNRIIRKALNRAEAGRNPWDLTLELPANLNYEVMYAISEIRTPDFFTHLPAEKRPLSRLKRELAS